MRDWYTVEHSDVITFANEIADEAEALFYNVSGEECACMARGKTFDYQLRGPERGTPFARFTRSSGNARGTPVSG